MNKNSRKLFVGLCAAAVVGLFSAGVRAEDKIAPGTMDFLASTTISGYVDVMYSYDFDGTDAQGATVGVGAGAGIGPRFNDFTLAQFKLTLEKPLDKSDWAAGYRVDIVGGQDAPYASANLGAANLTLNQAYVNARIPVGNGLEVKAGKYYVPFGNEVFETPTNFNITRSNLFLYAQPTTLTGIEFHYAWDLGGATLDTLVGIANRWDSVTDNNSSKDYYTQLRLTFWDGKASIASGIIAGTEGTGTGGGAFAGGDNEDYRWLWDSVVTIKPNDKWTFSLNGDVGQESFNNNAAAPGTAHNAFWGLSAIVHYKVSDKWDVAVRTEFFSDDEEGLAGNTRTGVAGGVDTWAVTGTVNVNIWKNLLTRMELRYANASEDVFSNDPDDDQIQLVLEAAYLF